MGVAEQLETLRADFRHAQAGIERLAASVSDAQWTTRPKGGGWSAAECIAHLTLTNAAYVPLLAKARAAAPTGTASPSRYKRSFAGWLLEWSLEPPARFRSKTIPAFIPRAAAPKATTVAAFVKSQDALLEWTSSGMPLDRMIIASPFNERLRYNAYSALRVLAAHERRHLWQAERAVRGVP